MQITDENEISLKKLSLSRLYFLSWHYQGGDKRYIPYDVCRVLLYTASGKIQNPVVCEYVGVSYVDV